MDASAYLDLKPNRNIPAFRVGDTVRVHATVVEGDRRRIQAFEGVVLRIRKAGISSSFTVRRVSHGIGVERVFPYYSPLVEKVEVTRVGKVRRARLYYLRDRVGKAARLKAGARARFEALQVQPMSAEEIDELMAEAEEQAAIEAEAGETTEEAAAEAEEGDLSPNVEEVVESEGGEPAAAAPAEESEAVVEPPQTPEAAAVEETIEAEAGEEPGEATGDR